MSKNFLDKVEGIISSSCLAGMAVIIAVQVFMRYVLQSSLDWSEELARYLFIWSVYVGCSYATQKDRHLEVTICRTVFGPTVAKYVTIAAYICTVGFCACTTLWGFQMADFLAGTGQKTPALEIQMYWVFLSVPVGMGLMAIRTVQRILSILRGEVDFETPSCN
ncbi:TRAP transporter small permease [Pseudodesulfovibrio sp. zrk46]|uniref:TRAP transporter small permease n=1 Tax=Pseudodesulfovibrio sp. zrk46 TaxID=2725288 RepID=UPI001448C8EC|nr:TRAP transporter small permease [Pseudodesulfovibrio sp. zrk46]QJB57410.1 TRAP transporter small permease [Pseudodesulfovibrio sp. zrk46]